MMLVATRVELGIVVEAETGSAGTQLLEELLRCMAVRVDAVTVGDRHRWRSSR